MIRAAMKGVVVTALLAVALAGCAGTGADPARVQSFQTRVFDTTDRQQVLRAILVTIQDLGLVPESAHAALGRVSALKWGIEGEGLDGDGVLRVRVKVRRDGHTRLLVQANMYYGLALRGRADHLDDEVAVEDPRPYHGFFRALERAMALDVHRSTQGNS